MNKETNANQVPDGIDVEAVTAWFIDHVPSAKPPFEFSLIAGGRSNLTYMCKDAAERPFVLRRPPLGHVLESAHDMGREHKIVSALAGSRVPVAVTHGLCSDPAVNGAPFYIMDFVPGQVFNSVDDVVGFNSAARMGITEDVITHLANLHAIDPDSVGLGDLGRKEAYLERQLKRWTKQWLAAKTHEIPEMDECVRRLAEPPEQVGASIVHGDYRVGNMILAGSKVQAVLDWELCTLGDPLADLGYLLNWWVQPGEDGSDVNPIGAGGFGTREYLSERYAELTGRDLSQINYYRAFSHWRLASIGQGVYKRYLTGAMGDTEDVDLEQQKEGVQLRAQAALDLLA